MGACKVVYYVTDSGRIPVEEFANDLDFRSRRKFVDTVELLENLGRELGWPHAKYIGDEIFELRFEGVEGSLRVLYFFFDGDKAVLTNGFPKQSNKTPKNEKQTAIGRRESYFQKHKGGLS